PGRDELGGILPARCARHPADHGASTHARTYAKERPQTPRKRRLAGRTVRLTFWTMADLEQTRRSQPRPPRPARAVSTMRLRRGNRGASSRMASHLYRPVYPLWLRRVGAVDPACFVRSSDPAGSARTPCFATGFARARSAARTVSAPRPSRSRHA